MAFSMDVLRHLAIYFIINLSLSVCNKLVLEKVPTPGLLTCAHATFTTLGCLLYLKIYKPRPRQRLTTCEHLKLLGFSCLFTINIAVSNASLSHVSLAFHQAARSTGPIFTLVIYRIWQKETYSFLVYASVTGFSIGIGLATYGDHTCTATGFWLTFAGIGLATIKTIVTNTLLTGHLKLHPFEALLYLCPSAAALSLSYACISGELWMTSTLYGRGLVSWSTLFLAVTNAILASIQNLSSFHTNKMAGALNMAFVANLKQVCTIVLAFIFLRTQNSLLGSMGIVVILLSAWCYSLGTSKQQRENMEPRSAVDLPMIV